MMQNLPISNDTYDVVTLGETMLRLTPPVQRRLEQTVNLDVEIGGSESNTAVGLVRLGLRVAWLSRLTANPLGQKLARAITAQGVDTSKVIWTDHDRVGLYFLEEGASPRSTIVTYDRAGSAMSRMQPADLPSRLFQPNQARLLHLSGITPALGSPVAQTARHALALAQKADWLVSFDLNYRARLWSPAEARVGLEEFMVAANLLIAPWKDIQTLFGLEKSSPEAGMEWLAQYYGQATIVFTLSKDGAVGRLPDGSICWQKAFIAQEVSRVGGGDAFNAGLLYGYLLSAPTLAEGLRTALRWGAAVAALKYTIPGDMPLVNYGEAARLVEQAEAGQVSLER